MKKQRIRIADIVFSVIMAVFLGLVLLGAAGGGCIGSKKLLLMNALTLLLLAVSLAAKHSEKGILSFLFSDVFQKLCGAAVWIATPVCLFYITQLGVYSPLSIYPKYVLYGLILGYLFLLLLMFLTGRAGAAGIIFSFAAGLFLLVDYFVTQFRGRPFTVMDIVGARTAANVMSQYELTMNLKMSLLTDAVIVLMILNWFYQPLRMPSGKKGAVIRGLGFLLSAGILAAFIQTAVVTKEFSTGKLFNPARTYGKFGYWFVMIAETSYLKVEEPEGYSPEYVAERTQALKDTMTAGTGKEEPQTDPEAETEGQGPQEAPAAETEGLKPQDTSAAAAEGQEPRETPENIIIIMNESFSDLETLGKIKTDTPLLPFFHSLEENTTKGKIYVHVYGGGTADTEYELLTGSSKEFLPVGMVAYEAYTHDPEYGLVTTLKEAGFRTVAMHPFRAVNWNRKNVYERMGFDLFYSRTNWPDQMETIRGFASDRSVYDTILKLYREKEKGERLFTFCVTMQNHGGYTQSTWTDGFEPTVRLKYKKSYTKAETFLTLANESDSAFEYLTEQFADSPEKTMIVMFGDHLPNLGNAFYNKILGKKVSKLTAEEEMIRYQTPYVIWTNYEREFREKDISANYLGSEILSEANLQMTPYNALQLEIMETLPVIGMTGVIDSSGVFHETGDLPEEYEALLNEYRIFQYNLIFDRKNLVTEAFVP